ncbi:MAG: hypothetical protein ACI8S7_002001 [Candidatus Krumholzibacteriia bacterium]|jgi:hypothetical protein
MQHQNQNFKILMVCIDRHTVVFTLTQYCRSLRNELIVRCFKDIVKSISFIILSGPLVAVSICDTKVNDFFGMMRGEEYGRAG